MYMYMYMYVCMYLCISIHKQIIYIYIYKNARIALVMAIVRWQFFCPCLHMAQSSGVLHPSTSASGISGCSGASGATPPSGASVASTGSFLGVLHWDGSSSGCAVPWMPVLWSSAISTCSSIFCCFWGRSCSTFPSMSSCSPFASFSSSDACSMPGTAMTFDSAPQILRLSFFQSCQSFFLTREARRGKQSNSRKAAVRMTATYLMPPSSISGRPWICKVPKAGKKAWHFGPSAMQMHTW